MTRALIIGAPRSGSGKTSVTIGLLRAFARRGFRGSDITNALREVLGSSRGGSAPEADNVITVSFRDAD